MKCTEGNRPAKTISISALFSMPKGSKQLISYRFQKSFDLKHKWLQKWHLKFHIFVVIFIQGSIYVMILSFFEAFAFRRSWTLVNLTHFLWKLDSLAAFLMGGTCVNRLFVKLWLKGVFFWEFFFWKKWKKLLARWSKMAKVPA